VCGPESTGFGSCSYPRHDWKALKEGWDMCLLGPLRQSEQLHTKVLIRPGPWVGLRVVSGVEMDERTG
jgi:hypothetical protein